MNAKYAAGSPLMKHSDFLFSPILGTKPFIMYLLFSKQQANTLTWVHPGRDSQALDKNTAVRQWTKAFVQTN